MSTNSTGFSSELYLSREQIRNQIIDYLKQQLELENVDLTKSSFLSYIVNILSTLTSNLMFYQSSVYKEFFLTKAQLPESVFNLAAFIGYEIKNASYATANLLITIPFSFSSDDVSFTIPEDFHFSANDIPFKTYYKTTINVNNNSNVTVTIEENLKSEGGTIPKVYNIPANIDTTSDNEFSFALPVKQINTNTQEFQIDSDLKIYQFTTINVPVSDELTDLTIEVKPPDSASWTTYQYYSSLYLMDPTTYGYTYQVNSDGIKLFFGNGLMGVQPIPDSTVRATINTTMGSDGNVIAGSINGGERIYVTDGDDRTILKYSVINPYPASGGKNKESLEEIKSNSIANLTSMDRLVSEGDYHNINKLKEKYLEDPSVINSIYPFLKRSDLKINEINMYVTTLYNSELAKTKTIYIDIDPSTNSIDRGTILDFQNESYVTLFNITIDYMNKAAYYDYVVKSIETTPVLFRTYQTDYNIIINNLLVDKELDNMIFKLEYETSESDYDQCTAKLEVVETGDTYEMTNDSSNKRFTVTISPYTKLSAGDFTYNFTITSPDGIVGTYFSNLMIRKDLRNIMQSDVISDSTNAIIYDIPVIPETYYNSLNLKEFETNIIQSLIRGFYTLNEYRMLTDFINMKFTNTYGKMAGMLRNEPTQRSILDFSESVPTNPNKDDRYILNKTGEIITCTDSTSVTYFYYTPKTNEIVYVESKDQVYVFNGSKWINPTYDIPLQLELEVFQKSGITQSSPEMINEVKTKLIEEFSNRFGANTELHRSEITKVVQELDFVDHCNVLRPETDIFFNFSGLNMTQTELLEYVPDYIYFNQNSINVRIL